MSELTNEQAYSYYCKLKKQTAKDYWYQFLKARADRGIDGAQKYVDKINLVK